jgi:hypothetical protein
VKNGEDDDLIILNNIENSIREPSKQNTTNISMDLGKGERMMLNQYQRILSRANEIHSQSLALLFVPKVGIREVGFGFGPKDNLSGHPRFRMRFLIWLQGDPREGFFRKDARRRSNSFFWEAVNLMALGAAAILSQMSSTRRIRSGILSFKAVASKAFLVMTQNIILGLIQQVG